MVEWECFDDLFYIGKVLFDEVCVMDVDLLVMGVWGCLWFSELVLGGVICYVFDYIYLLLLMVY